MSGNTRRAEGPLKGLGRAIEAAEKAEAERHENILKQHQERTAPKKTTPKKAAGSGKED